MLGNSVCVGVEDKCRADVIDRHDSASIRFIRKEISALTAHSYFVIGLSCFNLGDNCALHNIYILIPLSLP